MAVTDTVKLVDAVPTTSRESMLGTVGAGITRRWKLKTTANFNARSDCAEQLLVGGSNGADKVGKAQYGYGEEEAFKTTIFLSNITQSEPSNEEVASKLELPKIAATIILLTAEELLECDEKATKSP